MAHTLRLEASTHDQKNGFFYAGMGMIGIKFTTQMDQSSAFYLSRMLMFPIIAITANVLKGDAERDL